MFLGILNTILFKFSNNPFHLELRNRLIQIVVITSFVVISNVGIKRVDCTALLPPCSTSCLLKRHREVICSYTDGRILNTSPGQFAVFFFALTFNA